MKPLILIIGPEGSATTYIYKSLLDANPQLSHPAMKNGHAWPYHLFDKGPYPNWGIHHISLPAKRPCRWLEIENVPAHAKVVISTRNRKDAVDSAYRRFGKSRPHRKIEERQYDNAISMLPIYRETFETLDVRYEDLGMQRNAIEQFLGLSANWPMFRSRSRKPFSLGAKSHPVD